MAVALGSVVAASLRLMRYFEGGLFFVSGVTCFVSAPVNLSVVQTWPHVRQRYEFTAAFLLGTSRSRGVRLSHAGQSRMGIAHGA